jgi:hypothetical protein
MYLDVGRLFAGWLLRHAPDVADWDQVGRDELRRFVVWLRTGDDQACPHWLTPRPASTVDSGCPGYGKGYANNVARALQQFFAWYAEEEGVPNPMLGLRVPSAPKPDEKLVPVLTPEQRLGIPLHPHMFRHTFAHNWLDAGDRRANRIIEAVDQRASERDAAAVRAEVTKQIELHLAQPLIDRVAQVVSDGALGEPFRTYPRHRDDRPARRIQDDTIPIPRMPAAAAPRARAVAVVPRHPHSQLDEVRHLLDAHLARMAQILADAIVLKRGHDLVDGANIRPFPPR